MGMTTIEKILSAHAEGSNLSPGDIIECSVDTTVLIDIQFGQALEWEQPTRIADAGRVAVIMDHAVPAPTVEDANAAMRARRFVEAFGIQRFVDVGQHGICHQVIAERGWALPGQILVCTDSHTCAGGAFNCAARGLGPAEVLQVLCTGRTWFQVPATINYELTGALPFGTSGKDLFLYIAGNFGDANNCAIEFTGDGVETMKMSDRRTVATQGAEVGADFTLFPSDATCSERLSSIGAAPGTPTLPDPSANFLRCTTIDLASIPAYVARPGSVINNALPVSELGSVAVDQCFIGSCANGQLEDLTVAAQVLDGQRVAPGVRLLITPASQAVYMDALRLGIVETLMAAGAVVTNSTCGACFGYHMGVVGDGEVCLTSSTRNFQGRMGSSSAEVYMASPATVASSAIAGKIVQVDGTS